MGLVETGVKAVSRRMPKMISPTTHAVIDYAMAASFFVVGALLWRRHRRAAIASIACGLAEVATAAITDYPGGIRPMISLRTHERIDGSLAGMVGAMPLAMNFGDDTEAKWFRAQGVAIAAVTGLTDWQRQRLMWREAA
ncbi:MAG TPA: hypothetical protein VGL89_17830 [Candidatus Koribacter sp.]|jgi:hypothetical protein